MKLKTLALMGLCAAMAFTACKKDDDDKKEDTVSVVGTWKMTALTLTSSYMGQDSTEDLFKDMDACEKDDLQRFNEDKTVTSLSGATKCDPSDPSSEAAGTWSMSSDNKTLTLNDGGADVYNVLTLDAKTLKLSQSETQSGVKYSYTITMARQ